jgi:hypothetical protein
MKKEHKRVRAQCRRGIVGLILTALLFVVGYSLYLEILPASEGEIAEPTNQDMIVAEVGGEKITVTMFEERLRQYN